MKLNEHPLYAEDVARVAALPLPWEKMAGKALLLSGATGQVGRFLTDVMMRKNAEGLGCRVYALGRSKEKANATLGDYFGNPMFTFVAADINRALDCDAQVGTADFVLHLASNTHPLAYATDPIGTVMANVVGTANMLEFALHHGAGRCTFASSNEIYGENRRDTEFFAEDYCGYINCNTMRAGYPESKRCGEALCQAYIAQKGMDIVIPRLTRTYGPTLLASDTKAISQFLHKGVAGEDIVLKSSGTQYYSYTYVSDAVSGLLYTLLLGEKGEAYNIADPKGDIMLKDLAAVIAVIAGKKVVFELPDAVEASGYSKATKARLDGSKLRGLGWECHYDMQSGLERTVRLLKETV